MFWCAILPICQASVFEIGYFQKIFWSSIQILPWSQATISVNKIKMKSELLFGKYFPPNSVIYNIYFISFHSGLFHEFSWSFERTVEESFSIEHTCSRFVILVSFCISLMLLFWYQWTPHQHAQMAQGGWHRAHCSSCIARLTSNSISHLLLLLLAVKLYQAPGSGRVPFHFVNVLKKKIF